MSDSETIYMNKFEFWLFITFGWVAWIGSLFLIIGCIFFKKLRNQPGDIVLGLSIADFMLTSHWLVSAIFSGHLGKNLADNVAFCHINSFISVSSAVLEYCYSISLYTFLITCMRNTLKNSYIPRIRYHITSWIVSVLTTLYLFFNDMMGLNAYGTCSVKHDGTLKAEMKLGIIVIVLLIILNCVLGIYAYYYIKKNAPQSNTINKQTTEFLQFYNIYVFASLILWILASAGEAAAYLISDKSDVNKDFLSPLSNFFKLSLPLALTVIRYNDPLVKDQMRSIAFFWSKTRRRTYARRRSHPLSNRDLNENESMMNLDRGKELQEQLILISSESILESNSQRRNSQFSDDISSSGSAFEHETGVKALTMFLGIQTRFTILSGAKYCYLEYMQRSSSANFESEKTIEMEVNLEALTKRFPEDNFGKYPPLNGTITFHAPHIFTDIMTQNNREISIASSLDLNENLEVIKVAAGTDGGKSGEFFFFSKDNKLIIKTITDDEVKELLRVAESLRIHFLTNKGSLIGKVFGLFTFKRETGGANLHFIIIENVCGVPSEYILRQYDLKGSTYDRDALKGQDIVDEEELKKKTLKDLNFLKFEKDLKMSDETRLILADAAEKDANFFRSMGLMDYSLVVFVINKVQLVQDAKNNSALQELIDLVYDNVFQQGMGYRLGIIDYLQIYNIQKMLEMNLKRMKSANMNLDTSSQPPDVYAKRFIAFVKKILSVDPDSTADSIFSK